MRRLVARDVMNPEVLSIHVDSSVAELATFLLDNEISGAPVEDGNGHLVGVVSLTDIAMAASESGGLTVDQPDQGKNAFFAHGWEDKVAREELVGFHLDDQELAVRDIMTPAVFAVDADMPVSKVAATMLENHVHRLVVTQGAQVAGIITTSDLLGLLADEDED